MSTKLKTKVVSSAVITNGTQILLKIQEESLKPSFVNYPSFSSESSSDSSFSTQILSFGENFVLQLANKRFGPDHEQVAEFSIRSLHKTHEVFV